MNERQDRPAAHVGYRGQVEQATELRVGLIGCGSHAFRNIVPVLPFTRLRLTAACDRDGERARAFADRFGARSAWTDHHAMLAGEALDAVLIVTPYDEHGRPQYPRLAADCLAAGCHVWIEKPPAATCAEVEQLHEHARRSDRQVMVGFKKMFAGANAKARELVDEGAIGEVGLVTLQYPQYVPTVEQFREYIEQGKAVGSVVGFLDHLCHPASLLVHLLGMPRTLYYERSATGAGLATFGYDDAVTASLAMTEGQAANGGMERTMIVGSGGRHITVENNVRLSLHRDPPRPMGEGYGTTPSHFTGSAEQTSSIWEPEFSLGQLYNKGLFLLGYHPELDAFARMALDGEPLRRGTLAQAWQVTRMFEAFARGPGERHDLGATPRVFEEATVATRA